MNNTYIYTYIHMYNRCICLMYMYMYVYVCAYIYICIYIHIHTCIRVINVHVQYRCIYHNIWIWINLSHLPDANLASQPINGKGHQTGFGDKTQTQKIWEGLSIKICAYLDGICWFWLIFLAINMWMYPLVTNITMDNHHFNK